jgi:NADP-dependent 3-hydroxy acid dehydrogenase YdfG
MSGLEGRTAVVTGASRGIGLAIARALIAGGARVVMVARSAAELSDRARELGSNARALACDVADRGAVERACADIRREIAGPPDILVNNAGFFSLAPAEETRVEDLDRALEVNVVGPFLIVRSFLAAMRERASGHIVTIGSIADRNALPENSAYAASKFAARALHEVLRVELRGSGVRATLVSPGPVDTALWDEIQPDTRPGFTPRREMLAPEAVAAAVHYALTQPAEVNVDEIRVSRA